MKTYQKVVLVISVLLAFLLRVVKLDSIPPSLYWEEAALGYDAYSIAKTGKDYHGNPFPIVSFVSFGDYKPSLYFYTIVPFINLFGLSGWAVRLPSVLAGVGTVIVVFAIARKLYGENIGLLSAFFYAIQPWNMHISRVGFETNLATLLISLGVYFLLIADKKKKYLMFGAITFVLSMYTYHSARIVAPLLALIVTVSMKHFNHLKWLIISAVVALLLALPLLLNVTNRSVTQRAAETTIFSDISIIQESNALKEQDKNSFLSRIVHHRYLLFSKKIIDQYTKNFSPIFLFLDGDKNIRHGTGEFGLLYHWELPFILFALFVLVRNRKKLNNLPIIWILVSAIPVSVTTASPHTLRFMSAAPAFSVLTAIGVLSLISAVKKRWRKLFGIAISAVVLIELTMYLHFYFAHYAQFSAYDWQFGYIELIHSLRTLKKQGQKVYITRQQGRPSIYYLFYTKKDPATQQSQDKDAPKDQQELLQVDDYYFVDALPSEQGVLVASSPEKRDPKSPSVKDISSPNGKIIWSIWEKQ